MNVIRKNRIKRTVSDTIINTIVIMTVIILLLVLIIFIKDLIELLNKSLQKMEPTISAVVYGGIITLIASSLLQFLTRYLEKTKEIQLQIHQKKTDIYQELIRGLIDLISIGNKNPAKAPSEALRILTEWTPKAMAWASEDILIEWIELRDHAKELKPLEVINETGNLICSMRIELGLKVRKIRKIGLMKMIIK